MNIEDILPELFGEKRVYYCQRCENHGLRERRKNHKHNCLYRNCRCNDCELVERRRELNSRLSQMDGETDSTEGPSQSSDECGVQMRAVDDNSFSSKLKERRPNCQRCAQHNVVNRLKGHKRVCPFKECFCAKCQVVVERQKLMADQIKLRRKQKREKALVEKAQEAQQQDSDTSAKSICLKCTQQALGYQQLLSLLDPSSVSSASLLTLSAVLSACPHKN